MSHRQREVAEGGDGTTSFAVDAVRRLGSRLDSIQEKHDWAAGSEEEEVTILDDQQKEEGRSTGVGGGSIIDLSHSSNLHSMDQLRLVLQQTKSDEAVELARVTYAAYGLVLDRLLKDTERVNDQAWFWSQVEEDPGRTVMYLVQTLPARLTNLGFALAQSLSPNTSQPPTLDKESIRRAWRLLRDSPVLVIGALFPQTIRKGDASSPSSSSSAQKLLIARARALSPLGLTRHEARAKRKYLLQKRDALATRLGTLAQAVSKGTAGEGLAQSPEQLLEELGQDVDKMFAALAADQKMSSKQVRDSLGHLLTKHITSQQQSVDAFLAPSPSGGGPPSRVARLWPTFVLAPLGTIIVVRVVTASWDTIVEKAKEARETAQAFAVNWIYEPCLKLLDTIRTGDEEGVIMSKESLSSDLQSLERMVTEFSAEKYGLSGPELDAVTQRVREGDLTTVLKIYESELKSPLKSAISGSLIRSLLIQIQKVKVDIAVAMRGVDQLLKSQQLLFGAIGIAPAMGITYFLGSFLNERVSRALGQKGKEVGIGTRYRAWEAMRRIDKLLADPNITSGPLPPLTQGLLLLDLSTLRNLSPLLLSQVSRGRKGTAKRLRKEFLQDVRDLEFSSGSSSSSPSVTQVGLGWHARRASVDRMWKSWGSVISLVDL